MKSGIRSALISQSGDIYNLGDVHRFLNELNLYKHVGARFLCWLIIIGKLPPNRSIWVSKLSEMHESYVNSLKSFFNDENIDNFRDKSPLEFIKNKWSNVLNGDLKRTEVWFRKMTLQIGIQEYYLKGVRLRAERIITMIYYNSNNISQVKKQIYSYSQGNDRFVWVSFLISLYFASHGGLDADFAESMSFYLAQFFILNNKISKNIENLDYLSHHFGKLDAMVSHEEPEIYKYLSQSQHSALQYALKWELTMFSDEHNDIYELMLIWDSILERFDHHNRFIQCLALAHIKQVPLPALPDEMAMTIQQYRKWDTYKIIKDGIELFEEEEEDSCCNYITKLFLSYLRCSGKDVILSI